MLVSECVKKGLFLTVLFSLGWVCCVTGAEFLSDGTITSGQIRLWEAKRKRDINFTLPGDQTIISRFLFKLSEELWVSPSRFKIEMDKIDEKNKSLDFEAEYKPEKGSPIKYNRQVKLLQNGNIYMKHQYESSDKIYSVLILHIPKALIDKSAGVIIDGVKENPADLGSRPRKFLKDIEFTSSIPGRGFTIFITTAAKAQIIKKENRDYYRILLEPKNKTVEYKIAPARQSVETDKASKENIYYGIDFWDCNRMRLPDYRLCRNLIQNPSFEGGLRYYRYNGHSSDTNKKVHGKFYDIDISEAKFGNQSLAMKALKNIRPQFIGPFIIPVEPKKKYTFSFYAKGTKDKNLFLNVASYTASQKMGADWTGPRSFNLTKNWKRYDTSFISPNSGICLFLRAEAYGNSPLNKDNVWVDGLQLERGELTEYTEKPLSAELLTSCQGNFLEADKPINARLKITASPNIGGKLKLTVTDFFERKVWQKAFSFKTNAKGIAEIKLPLEKQLSKGSFLITADFVLDNGFSDTDYFRINIMDFLKGQHKHRNFISLNIPGGEPELARLFERYLAIGAGSFPWGSQDEHMISLASKYGIEYSGDGLLSSRRPLTCNGEKISLKDIAKLKSPIPQEWLKKIEQGCYEKAKSSPWFKKWWFIGEPDAGNKFNEELTPEDLVKIHKAAYLGIKRANPDNEFISPGPWNIRTAYGLRWIDDFLAAGAKGIPFAAVDGHAYQGLPEEPDLDKELEAFIKILNKHGLKNTPIISTEGIYHPPMNIPQWGSYTYNGGATSDSYWGKAPSYHMGLGEKMQSAFHARHFIMALKYADRIKSYDAHGSFRRFLDVDLTPYALCKTINTIGQLLGNADFKKDIRFAPDIRCYVFEDNLKRPLAAVWSHIKEADRNLGPYPTMVIPFTQPLPEVYDLMENPIKIKADKNGFCQIKATSFPKFFRGAPGSLDSFCKAFESAKSDDNNAACVKITAKLKTSDAISIVLLNIFSRKLEGNLEILCQGQKTFSGPITLMPTLAKNINATLSKPVSDTEISKVKLSAVFKQKSAPEEKRSFSLKTLAVNKARNKIKIDGDIADWAISPKYRCGKELKYHPKAKLPLNFRKAGHVAAMKTCLVPFVWLGIRKTCICW